MAGWSGETIRETGNGKRIMTRPNVGGLDPQTAALVRAAAALAEGKIAELKQRFVAARAAGVPDLWVEELLFQGLLVVGYPLALVAVAVWELVEGPNDRGGVSVGEELVHED